MTRKYWAYRIDKTKIKAFKNELDQGRLRQGWGWDEMQDLRNMHKPDIKNLIINKKARRNLPIFDKVKKGDILLVPHLPTRHEVAVVEATEDFDKGYNFCRKEMSAHGHIFPAKLIDHENVPGDIRARLKIRLRFWSINHCGDAIEKIIIANEEDLRNKTSFASRFNNILGNTFEEHFNSDEFSDGLYKNLNDALSNEEWEFALVEGLKKLFPSPMVVERTGGKLEKEHGTDILIRLPGLDVQYAIAIQVKDCSGEMGESPLQQIAKADDYWQKEEDIKLVDKYVIAIRCKEADNQAIAESAEEKGIKIIFAEDLKELLSEVAMSQIGLLQN